MRRARLWGTAVLIGLSLVLATAVTSSAQVLGTPEVYKVTLQSVAFSQSDDGVSGFTTVSTGPLELDIASGAAGATLANYIADAPLAPGTYRRMQIVVSCTFKLRGEITSLGVTYRTSASGTCANPPGPCGAAAENSFTMNPCPGGTTFTGTSPSGVIVFTKIQGTGVTAVASFDVTNAMQLVGVNLFPGNPSVNFSIQ
jgi:hypothetical protein